MISTRDAFDRIQALISPLTTERLPVAKAHLRVLASPLTAKLSKPGGDMAAMDGYAVNSADLRETETVGLTLLKGESRAGKPYDLALGSGEALRISTGALLPNGADQVVAQEDVKVNAGQVAISVDPAPGRHIRAEAADFEERETLLDAGTLLTPKSIGLVAAGGYDHVMVYRKPRVALFSSGDEIVPAGTKNLGPAHMIDCATPMISALLEDAGADIIDGAHLPDSVEGTKQALEQATDADVIITIGGASVGDHDSVQAAVKEMGVTPDFWKIAMRPGKPLMAGKKGETLFLSLPGNPVSAFVCALLFCRPAIDRMLGRPAPFPTGVMVPSATHLPEEGSRDHYYRARLVMTEKGPVIDPAHDQDSSLLSVLAACDGLMLRQANAPAIEAGDDVAYLPF